MSTVGGIISGMRQWLVVRRCVSVMQWLQDASRKQNSTTFSNIMIRLNVRYSIDGLILTSKFRGNQYNSACLVNSNCLQFLFSVTK